MRRLRSIASVTRSAAQAGSGIVSGSMSRSVSILGGGKATRTLKTLVSDEVGDDFEAEARRCGMTGSELLRLLVLVRVYGREQVASMARKHLDMAAGIVPESAQEGIRP